MLNKETLQVVVTFSNKEHDALARLAAYEMRTIEDQARHMVRERLKIIDLLPWIYPIGITAEDESTEGAWRHPAIPAKKESELVIDAIEDSKWAETLNQD